MGIIKIYVREAIFERDLSTFLSMNPRYMINYKDEVCEGKPAYDGGKTPSWHGEHELDVGDDPQSRGVMTFTFLNEDDLISSSEVSVAKLIKGRGTEHWHRCRFEGVDSGTFSVRVEYDIKQDAVEEEAPAEEAPTQEET